MLQLEESRLGRTRNQPMIKDTPSVPTVLYAKGNNTNRATGLQLCRNFQRGNCKFGERCRFIHGNVNQDQYRRNNNNKQAAKKSSPVGFQSPYYAGQSPVAYYGPPVHMLDNTQAGPPGLSPLPMGFSAHYSAPSAPAQLTGPSAPAYFSGPAAPKQPATGHPGQAQHGAS